MNEILRIENAAKHFTAPEGGTVKALDGVNLTVARNEFLTLLGPSGCGKTTLLRTVSGFEDLDSGEIFIDGQPMRSRPAHLRPVNTVFQRYALFSHLTWPGTFPTVWMWQALRKDETSRRVGDMLELVGLAGLGGRKISQLSGGQQQRVCPCPCLDCPPQNPAAR